MAVPGTPIPRSSVAPNRHDPWAQKRTQSSRVNGMVGHVSYRRIEGGHAEVRGVVQVGLFQERKQPRVDAEGELVRRAEGVVQCLACSTQLDTLPERTGSQGRESYQ